MKVILIHIFLAILITYPAFPDGKSKIQPVELTDFNATNKGEYVELEWSTSSEQNSSKFIVERAILSDSGASKFSATGIEVEAVGKSAEPVYYGPVSDYDVEYGITYIYRLRAMDLDGTSSLSEERVMEVKPKFKVDFNLKYISEKIEIDWTIENPENIEYYYIERKEYNNENSHYKLLLLDSIKAKESGNVKESCMIYDDSFKYKTKYIYKLLIKVKDFDKKFELARSNTVYINGIQSVENDIISGFNVTAPNNSDKIHFNLELEKPSNVHVNIYNTLGSKIKTLNSGLLGSGTSEFFLNRSELSPGTYFYTIQSDDSILSGKFQVIK